MSVIFLCNGGNVIERKFLGTEFDVRSKVIFIPSAPWTGLPGENRRHSCHGDRRHSCNDVKD